MLRRDENPLDLDLRIKRSFNYSPHYTSRVLDWLLGPGDERQPPAQLQPCRQARVSAAAAGLRFRAELVRPLRRSAQRARLHAPAVRLEPQKARKHDAETGGEVLYVGRSIARLAAGGDAHEAARRFIDYWNGAGSFERMEPGQQARLATQMPRVVAHFAALFADATPLHLYARLHVPALLLSGRTGPRCGPQVAEILSDTLPRAGALWLPDLGHMGPVTDPGAVNGVIARFVERHTATAPALAGAFVR